MYGMLRWSFTLPCRYSNSLIVAFLANFVATLVQFPLFHVPAAGSTDLYSEHNFVHPFPVLPAFAGGCWFALRVSGVSCKFCPHCVQGS